MRSQISEIKFKKRLKVGHPTLQLMWLVGMVGGDGDGGSGGGCVSGGV